MINISIIIPVYNAEKYLDKCLMSVLNKKHKDVEVILIDDGSTDNSSSIYLKYEKHMRIYKNSNHGVSYSRNFGLSKATGKYIMFVDSDDYLIENWYDVVNSYLNTTSDIIILSSNFKELDFDISNKNAFVNKILNISKNNLFLSSPCSKLYKREYLEKNGILFDENVKNGEDMLFNIKGVINTNNILLDRNSIYIIRKNNESVSHIFSKQIIDSDIEFNRCLSKILLGKLSNIQIQNILSKISLNGLSMILSRISFLACFQDAHRYYSDINLSFYKEKIKISNYFSIKGIFVILLYLGLYHPIYSFYKLKNNRNLKKENSNEII